MGRVLICPQGRYITMYLWVLLQELSPTPPLRWRVITLGWGQDFWNTTLLPHHHLIRRKSHTPNLPLKPLPPKPSWSSGLLSSSHPFSWIGPWGKPCSAPDSDVLVCLTSLCVRHMNLLLTIILVRQPGACAHGRSALAGGQPLPWIPSSCQSSLCSGEPGGSLLDRHQLPQHKAVWSWEMSWLRVHFGFRFWCELLQLVRAGNSSPSIWVHALSGNVFGCLYLGVGVEFWTVSPLILFAFVSRSFVCISVLALAGWDVSGSRACMWWHQRILPYCTGFAYGTILAENLPFLELGNCNPERLFCVALVWCLLDTWQHQPWLIKHGWSELCSILESPRLYFTKLGDHQLRSHEWKKIIFYCNTAWPQSSLGSGEQWPLMAL